MSVLSGELIGSLRASSKLIGLGSCIPQLCLRRLQFRLGRSETLCVAALRSSGLGHRGSKALLEVLGSSAFIRVRLRRLFSRGQTLSHVSVFLAQLRFRWRRARRCRTGLVQLSLELPKLLAKFLCFRACSLRLLSASAFTFERLSERGLLLFERSGSSFGLLTSVLLRLQKAGRAAICRFRGESLTCDVARAQK